MKINISNHSPSMVDLTLPFYGKRPDGTEISVTNKYLVKDGVPWLPVMGEFHFSRYPCAEWETELSKMKAGGIDIAATYCFWIHHEEEKGDFDFTKERNLRDFIKVCKKIDFPLLLRIGPWAHGECRNGGFPDWLEQDKSFQHRTNDKTYLSLVDRWFSQLYEQAKGYLWKDNGPIVGIQIENEYGHCGGPNGTEGMAHMKTLKEMAKAIGFDVPLYTATGWGGAVVVDGEMLPVLGGYADAPWEQHTNEMPPSKNFLFTHVLNDSTIGTDLKKIQNYSFTYDVNAYPYLTAELGGGMQATQHRRPVASVNDTVAMSLCKLGAGANLLGYYMYHGGINPEGKLSTLQESKATGYPNDLPIKSYDFGAPLKECGNPNESYGQLRRLSMFLREWGTILTECEATLPKENNIDPSDTTHLRFSVRHNSRTNQGFLFINNHLRLRDMADHNALSVTIESGTFSLEIPPLTIKNHDILCLPYHFPMGSPLLLSTNAQALTKIGERYFFYTDQSPVYEFQAKKAEIITLSTEQANRAVKLQNKLYITNAVLFEDESNIIAEYDGEETELCIFSETGEPITQILSKIDTSINVISTQSATNEYELTFTYDDFVQVDDILLTLLYLGDKAELYLDEHLISDWFTVPAPYTVALKRYGYPQKLTLKIYPTDKDVYYDKLVPAGCELLEVSLRPRFHHILTRSKDL